MGELPYGLRAFQRAKIGPQDTQLNTTSCTFLPKIKLNTAKPVINCHSKRRQNIGFQDRLSLDAGEHSAGAFCNTFDLH